MNSQGNKKYCKMVKVCDRQDFGQVVLLYFETALFSWLVWWECAHLGRQDREVLKDITCSFRSCYSGKEGCLNDVTFDLAFFVFTTKLQKKCFVSSFYFCKICFVRDSHFKIQITCNMVVNYNILKLWCFIISCGVIGNMSHIKDCTA